MKTKIGIASSEHDPYIKNIVEEFFGKLIKHDKRGKVLWLMFPSKAASFLFLETLNFECVDVIKKIYAKK